MNWGQLNLEGNPESLTNHRKYLDGLEHIHKRVRDASHTLRASNVFAPVNFTAVIEDLAKERALTGRFKLTIDADREIDWSIYKDPTKMDLYYYINEVLQNCILHAKATKVKLKLKIKGLFLEITIADNGVGMSKINSKGISLKKFQPQINKLKGKFTIKC